jgi:hypothetical protein
VRAAAAVAALLLLSLPGVSQAAAAGADLDVAESSQTASLLPDGLAPLLVPSQAHGLGDLSPEEAAALRKRMNTRRVMMDWHQGMAIASWAVMTVNIAVGSAQYANRVLGAFIPGRGPRTVQVMHKVTSYTTGGLYLGTGILAWLSPPPIRRPMQAEAGVKKKDSSKLHRTLSIVHGAGMAALVVGGILNSYLLSQVNQPWASDAWIAASTVHLAAGYATYALTTAAGVAILFF